MTDTIDRPKTCWSSLPVYRPGGRLSAEQLMTEQRDAEMRERLLNLALHGTGVVHGFDIAMTEDGRVKVTDGCIHVGCGLALDPRGRTLYWAGGPVAMDDIVGKLPDGDGCYTLAVHYAERADQGVWDPCHDGASWVHRCVAFTLSAGCTGSENCPERLPEDTCAPRRDFVCHRIGTYGAEHRSPDLDLACVTPPPLEQSDCGRVGLEKAAGIPLVCLGICDLDKDDAHCPPRFGFCPCETPEPTCDDDEEPQKYPPKYPQGARPAAEEIAHGGKIPDGKRDEDPCDCGSTTPCDMRPVAYRAPVLWEAINGADIDLPKIAKYTWWKHALGPWETRMPISEFRDRVLACVAVGDGECDRTEGRSDGFAIAFTKPVLAETLHPLSILFEIYIRENEYDREYGKERVVNWKHHRVPVHIEPLLTEEDRHCAWGAAICPSDSWWRYIERSLERCANDGQLARVEITVRGQKITDKCGCMLDAQPPELTCRDHCGTKTGQSRPGGDWVSLIRIGEDTGDDAYDDDAKRKAAAAGFATQRNGETS
ncbi:MAG: hypothetical protein AAFR35_09840 [Pseudomonadota bacterium]